MNEPIYDWMQTYTGVQFWPLDPRMEDIRFADIAMALSRICRFGGHCTHFYSVAEHSVHVASKAPNELKLQALMHDAAEAYLGDVVRAIKRNLPNYERIEARLERLIFEKFGIEYPCHPTVKALDDGILVDEREQNMVIPPAPWTGAITPIGVTLEFWTPSQARYEFTTAFHRYGGKS